MRRFVGCVLSVAVFATPVDAGSSAWYASIEGGVSSADAVVTTVGGPACGILGLSSCEGDGSTDAGWAGFASVGANVSESLRIEAEVGQRNSQLGGRGDLTSTTLMLNGRFEVPLGESLSILAGAGIGVDWISTEEVEGLSPDSGVAFACQGIAGLSYALSDQVDLTLTYRYLDTEGADEVYAVVNVKGTFPALERVARVDDVSANSVTIGLRFGF